MNCNPEMKIVDRQTDWHAHNTEDRQTGWLQQDFSFPSRTLIMESTIWTKNYWLVLSTSMKLFLQWSYLFANLMWLHVHLKMNFSSLDLNINWLDHVTDVWQSWDQVGVNQANLGPYRLRYTRKPAAWHCMVINSVVLNWFFSSITVDSQKVNIYAQCPGINTTLVKGFLGNNVTLRH